jgi:diketogulonate reductase-like aldo/keto reductase
VRPQRIAENIDIFDFELESDEVQEISALDTGERGGPDPKHVSPQTFPLTHHD